jgi:Mn2+/Fe2+ NRAMP family transporter
MAETLLQSYGVKQTSILLGAAFLMATSAIGPGFLTQTTVFTQQLRGSFGFVILLSILLDLGAQLNIWRVVAVTERRGQDVANSLLPGLGYLLAGLIVVGGLAFNIGNVAGAGLGLNILTGLDINLGAVGSAAVAIFLFLSKEAGKAMDRFAQAMGVVMLLLIVYVVFTAHPPLKQAITQTFFPQQFDALATITLVGGTVGGYISFAGAHRLLDAGVTGSKQLPPVNRSATAGILVTSLVRYLLFLATFGVVASGFAPDAANPPASVFRAAAGEVGFRCFGVVMWCAAITSVVGSAYTSVSFLRTFHPWLERHTSHLIVVFIAFSTLIFVGIGKPPAQLLVWVGTLNGFILPVALAIMLVAAQKARLVGSYRHPVWLRLSGWLVVVIMTVMAVRVFF